MVLPTGIYISDVDLFSFFFFGLMEKIIYFRPLLCNTVLLVDGSLSFFFRSSGMICS